LADGLTDPADVAALMNSDVAAVVVAQPNFLGGVENAGSLSAAAHAGGALLVALFNPISLGLLPPPGEYDADIAVAEGQPLGLPQSFGGPGLGLFCCRRQYARFAPGRLVGLTADGSGRRGFTLTLQTREQHIRREKATSNICTNQALCALQASIYLTAVGPQGLAQVADACFHKAHYLADKLQLAGGGELLWNGAFFHEFAFRLPSEAWDVASRIMGAGMIGGYHLGRDYPQLGNAMLVCATEKRSKAQLDLFARTLAESGA
jgi:glycine dehydrogenase subunit 1